MLELLFFLARLELYLKKETFICTGHFSFSLYPYYTFLTGDSVSRHLETSMNSSSSIANLVPLVLLGSMFSCLLGVALTLVVEAIVILSSSIWINTSAPNHIRVDSCSLVRLPGPKLVLWTLYRTAGLVRCLIAVITLT